MSGVVAGARGPFDTLIAPASLNYYYSDPNSLRTVNAAGTELILVGSAQTYGRGFSLCSFSVNSIEHSGDTEYQPNSIF